MKQILIRWGHIQPEILLKISKNGRWYYWWSEGFGIADNNSSKLTKDDVRRNIEIGNFLLFKEL